MIDEVLRRLVEFAQEASPLVWIVTAVFLSVLVHRFCALMMKADDEGE